MTNPHGFEMAADFPPHEAFDPNQLVGPDDVILGVEPLAFADATGFRPGVDRTASGPELLEENKKLREEVKQLRYDTLLGVVADQLTAHMIVDVTAHGASTLDKVRESFDLAGLNDTQATLLIDEMLNQGILFRERRPEGVSAGDVSDGHHTFNDLYEHRRALTAVLATIGAINGDSWRSKLHHPEDGPMFDGSFIVGIELTTGPISYHYPLSSWDEFAAVPVLEHAPKWDGAGPADTLTRLAEFTAHLRRAIDDGHMVQVAAREAADAVVEAAEQGSPCTGVVAAKEEQQAP